MNPNLYNLPVKQAPGYNLKVIDSEGTFIAHFNRNEQAADFVASLNQFGPKRPKEMWAVWNKTTKRWMWTSANPESIWVFPNKQSAEFAKQRCATGSLCEWVVVNLADLPSGE